jgi:hypothetical protein
MLDFTILKSLIQWPSSPDTVTPATEALRTKLAAGDVDIQPGAYGLRQSVLQTIQDADTVQKTDDAKTPAKTPVS